MTPTKARVKKHQTDDDKFDIEKLISWYTKLVFEYRLSTNACDLD